MMSRRRDIPSVRNSIRKRRKESGLSQQELARLAGVSRQTLNSVETGRSEPGTALALSVARVLAWPVEELFQLPDAGSLVAHVAPPFSGKRSSRAALAEVGGRWVAQALPADSVTVGAG